MPRKSSSRRSRSSRTVAAANEWDRRQSVGMQLHDSEKLLVGFLGLFLIFLPWAFGTTHFWAQIVAAFIALCALGASILPRHGDTHTVTIGGQLRRIALFPGTWFGGLFLIYLAVQNLLVSSPVETGERVRWLVIFAAPILASCAAWVGLTRRKSVNILIGLVAINAAVLTLIGFLQIRKSSSVILWFYNPEREIFLSTFPFHWQGAAYFTIALAGTLGLGLYHYLHALKTFRRSSPSGLYEFIAFVLLLLIVFSHSHLAATLAGILAVAFVSKLIYRHLGHEAPASRKALLLAISAVITVSAGFFTHHLAETLGKKAPADDLAEAIAPVGSWNATAAIGGEMLRQKPVFGWGIGSFPHLYREIGNEKNIADLPPSLDAENSVGEIIRLPAEIGILGSLLLLLPFLYLLKFFFNKRILQNPLAGFLLLGTLSGAVLSIASPTFGSGAFLGTWILFLTFGGIVVRVENAVRAKGEQLQPAA